MVFADSPAAYRLNSHGGNREEIGVPGFMRHSSKINTACENPLAFYNRCSSIPKP